MERNNVTTIHLLGFPELHRFRIALFLFLLITYLTTISGNLMVLIVVSFSKNLHCPMYFFLSQLTISDIMTTSDIIPNMLLVVLNNGSSMSIPQCFTQLLFFGSSEAAECFLLTVMSYDRYLAICHPLYYDSIMNNILCLKLIVISWTLAFAVTSTITVSISQFQFCRSGVDHFFCDLDPVLQLSCFDIWRVKLMCTIFSFLGILCPFLIVVISYAYIVHTILRIQSISHRQKAFSTCGSHLTVVSIFYGALVSVYLSPDKGKSSALHKVLSMLYSVLTPLINPIIYSLRNKDIKEAFAKIF
ncbi:hypothetical protein GDO81_011604 [Engystomops pustulosus]|uniref:Olfactory receptor n=1 Tax=Engystomops pustulosus TaxID=76066 RepID=A0AAV7BFG7_ENGPU|nr:hypothetical protein GDO81_029582 [Engystomops pustulosus]KAG8571340.1 hypothetical protein GDO81_011604 [Engystomops pustulosus]